MQSRIYSCSPSIGSAAVAVFCWYDRVSRKSLREPVGRIIRNEFRDGQQVNNLLSDRSLNRAYETVRCCLHPKSNLNPIPPIALQVDRAFDSKRLCPFLCPQIGKTGSVRTNVPCLRTQLLCRIIKFCLASPHDLYEGALLDKLRCRCKPNP
jgi:hypothetical protein